MARFEESFDEDSKVYQVYLILKDREWHCRECEYKHTGITQIAGGSGIQGLQRGTKSRQGMVIESGNHFCEKCGKTTRHDRWQGGFQPPSQGSSMPVGFARMAVRVLRSRDVVEKTERPLNQLTLDHKLPRHLVPARSRPLNDKLERLVKRLGEPMRSEFTPEELRGEMARIGFAERETLPPEEQIRRYLGGRSDVAEPAPNFSFALYRSPGAQTR